MEYQKNEQFANYISVFSTDIIYKLLLLQKDKEILSRTAELLERMQEADKNDISFQQHQKNLLQQGTPMIEPFDAIVYRLSNPFMEMGIEDVPYQKVMTCPVNDKMVKVLILLKWISSRNRMATYKGLNTPGITQTDLDAIQIGIKLESLAKVLELLKTNLDCSQEEEGLRVKLYGNLNIPHAVADNGSIQYDMKSYEDLIETMYLNLKEYQLSIN